MSNHNQPLKKQLLAQLDKVEEKMIVVRTAYRQKEMMPILMDCILAYVEESQKLRDLIMKLPDE